MKNTLLLLMLLLSFFACLAQYHPENSFAWVAPLEFKKNMPKSPLIKEINRVNYIPVILKKSYNSRVGLGGRVTYFTISSSDVNVAQQAGWSANFETRGQFRDDFDLIYSIGIFSHHFAVNENVTNDQIDMSVVGVEIKFLLAWKIAQSDHFSMEIGPALQLNGELKIGDEDQYQESFTGGLNPVALKQFQNTMPLNLNGVVGFSGGVRNFRVSVHYHYSFLDALTGTNLAGKNINGHFSFVSLGAMVYL
jgi:hypothetical protein